MARFSSKIKSFFLRIFLLAAWAILVVACLYAMLLTIYPNVGFLSSTDSFGVWKTQGQTLSTSLSSNGIALIVVSGVALVFSIIIQSIAKKASFRIGSRNQILGYFSTVTFPLVVFTIFAFISSYHFSTLKSIPGFGEVHSLFYSTAGLAKLIGTNNIPLFTDLSGTSWVWILFGVFGIISLVGIVFSTIKMIFRAVFSRTHDKENINI